MLSFVLKTPLILAPILTRQTDSRAQFLVISYGLYRGDADFKNFLVFVNGRECVLIGFYQGNWFEIKSKMVFKGDNSYSHLNLLQ